MQPDITIEYILNRYIDAVRHTNITHYRTRSCYSQCHLHSLICTNAFKRSVDTYSICQVQYSFVCFSTTLCYDIRSTEFSSKLLAGRVSAQGNDSLCA